MGCLTECHLPFLLGVCCCEGLSMVTLAGTVSPVGGHKCERSIGGNPLTCVGVYENGTYMYGGCISDRAS